MAQVHQNDPGCPEGKSDSGIPSDSAQLLGLSAASIYGSFTTSGSALSLIYDAMTVAWNNGGAPPEDMPASHFAIIANEAARGKAIRLELRGFCSPPGAGRFCVEIGGRASEVPAAEEHYGATAEGVLDGHADATVVLVRLDLPEPAEGGTAMLTLDSIDIGFAEPAAGDEGGTG